MKHLIFALLSLCIISLHAEDAINPAYAVMLQNRSKILGIAMPEEAIQKTTESTKIAHATKSKPNKKTKVAVKKTVKSTKIAKITKQTHSTKKSV